MDRHPALLQGTVLDSVEQLDALHDAWRALETHTRRPSAFTSWDWQRLWWKHYGAGRELRVLVARDASRVVGIVPLYRQRIRLGRVVPLHVLRPLGVGGDTAPDDLEPLWAAGYEQAAADALARLLACAPGWELLQLGDLDPDGAWLQALGTHLRGAGFACWEGHEVRIPYGDLPASWEAFVDSLHRDRRQKLRRTLRQFEREPGAALRRLDAPEEVDAGFEQLARLHRARWQGHADALAFRSPAYLGFHRELMHALAADGRLRLYALEIGGDAVAMLYGMRIGDTLYYFQSGFDPARAALSPGVVLVAWSIRSAIDEGCTRFDMLKGDYEHKRHFFRQIRVNSGLYAARPGWPAWLVGARRSLGRLRRRLRPAPAPAPARGHDARDPA